jgi:hypothetical protein
VKWGDRPTGVNFGCRALRIDEPWAARTLEGARRPEDAEIVVGPRHELEAGPHNITEFKTARVLAVGNSRAEAKERARPQLDSIYEWGCRFTGPIHGPRFGYRPWLIP